MHTLAHVSHAIDPRLEAELQALTDRIRNAPEAGPDVIAEAARDLLRAEAAYLQARTRLYALCQQQVA